MSEDTDKPPSDAPNLAVAAAAENKRQSRKRRRAAKRQEQRAQTTVYVTGVPNDATLDELESYFAKCGVLLPNPEDGRARIKLYVDEQGQRKGDALVTYARAPSVENAVTLLDGVPLRYGGEPMRVQQASFEHKDGVGSGGAARAVAVQDDGDEKKRARRGAVARALVDEALSWEEERVSSAPAARMVVLKNVFDASKASEADYKLVDQDMVEGCGECGVVEKITVFQRNPQGVVAVRFSSVIEARECIRLMNGRWYDGRQLTAEFFDGVTDYRVKLPDDDQAAKERDKDWEKWLGGEEDDDGVDVDAERRTDSERRNENDDIVDKE